MIFSNDKVGRQTNLVGRTQSSGDAFVSKGLNSGTERVSNSDSVEAGTVLVGKIDEGLI